MNNIRIALIQMPVATDKAANLETAADYVSKAAGQGAQIVVLPEMFCCPYENSSFVKNAEPEGENVWQALSKMAAENHILLIGGSMPEREGTAELSEIKERTDRETITEGKDQTDRAGKTTQKEELKKEEETGDGGSRIYNTCYIFNSQGQQIGKHRKVHLFDINIPGGQYFKESDTFTPGDQITVVDTEYGRIGVEICFDIRFTELTHLMALEDAEMVFVPAAFNMTTGPAHWQLHFRARALDSQIYLFGCSPARDMNASYHAYGHSIITSPWGDVVAELDEKPGMLIQDIDPDRVAEIRGQLPILKARREDVYQLKKAKV